MIDEADLTEWERLAAACFEGPWTASEWSVDCDGVGLENCDGGCTACDGEGVRDVIAIEAPEAYPDGQVIGTCGLSQFSSAHSAFISAARTAVPVLVAALREAWAAVPGVDLVELYRERDNSDFLRKRAKAAEAEAVRLREALEAIALECAGEPIADWPIRSLQSAVRSACHVARAALEGSSK